MLVTHMGLNLDEKDNAVATVLEHLETKKCIFMGDINILQNDLRLDPIRQRMSDTGDFWGEERLSFPSHDPDQ